MKTPLPQSLRPCGLLVLCAVLLSTPAFAKERFRIPPPPSPEKVVRDIRGFFQRITGGVKDVSKKTWNAIRDPFVDDEPPARPPRSKSGSTPPEDGSAFSRSKEAVPYRHDDADMFDTRLKPQCADGTSEAQPKVNVTTRDPAATPPEQVKPAEPATRRPFLKPETPSTAEQTPAPPKVTPPTLDSNLEFGRTVPGKRGLVYPPGARDAPENMVDVGDFQTGQIVRDPRTGKLFRVP